MDGLKEGRSVSLTRRMSKVGLLAAMKTFTRPHFQRKKKNKAVIPENQSQSISVFGHNLFFFS